MNNAQDRPSETGASPALCAGSASDPETIIVLHCRQYQGGSQPGCHRSTAGTAK
jgi:hypothetical protein